MGGKKSKKRGAVKARRELMVKLPTAGIMPNQPITCMDGHSPDGLLLLFLKHHCLRCESSFWYSGGLDEHNEVVHDEETVCSTCKQVVDHSAVHTLKIPKAWHYYFVSDAEDSVASKLEEDTSTSD